MRIDFSPSFEQHKEGEREKKGLEEEERGLEEELRKVKTLILNVCGFVNNGVLVY